MLMALIPRYGTIRRNHTKLRLQVLLPGMHIVQLFLFFARCGRTISKKLTI
jgi:hypothetical protein